MAVRRLALVSDFDRSPTVGRVRDVPAGQLLDVRVPPGLTAVDLEDRAEALAVCLEVRDVRVKRDPDNAARSTVTVVRRDPLAAMGALAWPLAEAERVSLWEPIPVAVDEDGQPVTVRLPERNVIFGGEPGAGKSVAQSLPVAAAALDPDVDLYLFDGNQVEFAPWAACATRTVGPDMAQAVDVLGELGVEMDARYAVLLGEGRRKIAPGDGMRLIVVAVNELAFYTATGDRKQRTEFADRLRDLVARGRAAGIIVLAATQRPSSDVVPTSLRDLFGFRWALRCSTPDASDTILGRGWATNGVTATDVPAEARGVGYLLAEGGQPVRCKAYYLDDDTIHAIAPAAPCSAAGVPDRMGWRHERRRGSRSAGVPDVSRRAGRRRGEPAGPRVRACHGRRAVGGGHGCPVDGRRARAGAGSVHRAAAGDAGGRAMASEAVRAVAGQQPDRPGQLLRSDCGSTAKAGCMSC